MKSYANVISKIPKKISQKSIDKFVMELRKRYSNASIRVVLSILKNHLDKIGKASISSTIILPKKEAKRLEIPDIDIQNAIELSKKDPFDHAIIMTLASTGLRLSELCNLKLSDYLKDQSQVSVIGKGNKERLVFFSDKARKAIDDYIKVRNHASDWLFVSGYGKCYQKVIDRILKKYSKKLHPHIFRHHFATKLLNAGADLMAVKDLLGHTSILTTQIYLNLSNNRLKEVSRLIN